MKISVLASNLLSSLEVHVNLIQADPPPYILECFCRTAKMSKEATKTLMSEEDDPYNMDAAQDLLMDGQKKLVIVRELIPTVLRSWGEVKGPEGSVPNKV